MDSTHAYNRKLMDCKILGDSTIEIHPVNKFNSCRSEWRLWAGMECRSHLSHVQGFSNPATFSKSPMKTLNDFLANHNAMT